MSVNAIRPEEIKDAWAANIPDQVIEIFNKHIVKNYNGMRASVKQNTVVSEIANVLNIDRDQVYKLRYLEIESIFEKAGWKVKYDKPGYNEDYDAFFEFIKE